MNENAEVKLSVEPGVDESEEWTDQDLLDFAVATLHYWDRLSL